MPIKMKDGEPHMSHADAEELYKKFVRENHGDTEKAHKQFGAVMESEKRKAEELRHKTAHMK